MKKKIEWLTNEVINLLKNEKGIIVITDHTSVDMSKLVKYQAIFGDISKEESQKALVKILEFLMDTENEPTEGFIACSGKFAVFVSIRGFNKKQNRDMALKICQY